MSYSSSFYRAEQAWLTPPEEPTIGYCEHCGGDLYKGDEVVKFDGEIFCDKDCLLEYLEDEIEEIVMGEDE